MDSMTCFLSVGHNEKFAYVFPLEPCWEQTAAVIDSVTDVTVYFTQNISELSACCGEPYTAVFDKSKCLLGKVFGQRKERTTFLMHRIIKPFEIVFDGCTEHTKTADNHCSVIYCEKPIYLRKKCVALLVKKFISDTT